jgi:hypothetical protein
MVQDEASQCFTYRCMICSAKLCLRVLAWRRAGLRRAVKCPDEHVAPPAPHHTLFSFLCSSLFFPTCIVFVAAAKEGRTNITTDVSSSLSEARSATVEKGHGMFCANLIFYALVRDHRHGALGTSRACVVFPIPHRGSPFPAPPPAEEATSAPLTRTPGPLAPGCLLNANSTGSSRLPSATPPALTPAAPAVAPADWPDPSPGPRRISSSSPRSRHAGSFFVCVARWIPKAAC